MEYKRNKWSVAFKPELDIQESSVSPRRLQIIGKVLGGSAWVNCSRSNKVFAKRKRCGEGRLGEAPLKRSSKRYQVICSLLVEQPSPLPIKSLLVWYTIN